MLEPALIYTVNGRFAAAEKMIEEVNVECLSLSRTEALCGYPFDFTAAGTECTQRAASLTEVMGIVA